MKRVYEFLKEAGAYFIATLDGKQPRVRPFASINIFENKLYIHTGRGKNVERQIAANPLVELCALKGDEWLRVEGALVLDERAEARESMLATYPSDLRKRYEEGGKESSVVLYFKDATATFYSFSGAPLVIKF